MYCLNVILTVKDEADIPKVAELLAEAGRLSAAEQDCLQFEVCHSQDDPSLFLLCERWESKEAWEEHLTRRAVTEIYKPQVLPLVNRTPHRCEILNR